MTKAGQMIGSQIADLLCCDLISPDNCPSKDITRKMCDAFLGNHPIIGVCSAGIIIRTLSPFIKSKHNEPPVIAISEDGQFVIPLLGGHYSANILADKIGKHLNAKSAISTGSYVTLGLSLSEPPKDWKLMNPADVKRITARILRGKKVEIIGDADWIKPLINQSNIYFTTTSEHNRIVVKAQGLPSLVYQKKEYALGVGCIRNCPSDDLIGFVNSTLSDHGISAGSIEGIYSLDLKSDEPAIHDLAQNLGVEAHFYPSEILECQYPNLQNPSEEVYQEVGCHGVSEGACLTRAGHKGHLTIEKIKTSTATMALAKIGPTTTNEGVPRGKLSVVGIGPGNISLRTPEVSRVLADADVIVGYKRYLTLLDPLPRNKEIVPFELGEEEKRCRFSLETAGLGKQVVLVCSGDSNIFAMNSLVMELLELPASNSGVSSMAKKTFVQCLPGITAMQAASAKGGGLIGHDFCAISLSNLLTDEETILERVKRAAQGDFVISLYNPASRKRRTLLDQTLNIIRKYRPENTPIVVARNIGRSKERIALKDLKTFQAEEVDMLTVLIVGNSHSRTFATNSRLNGIEGHWAYTPRGYNKKFRHQKLIKKEAKP